MYKNIIVLRAKHIVSLGRVKLELCVGVLETLRIWGSDEKVLWGLPPHYRSCHPPSTHMRGPTLAWGFYLELVSAARRWLILHSYHSAPWELQLLFPCHHGDSVAATLQFLPNQNFPWQGLSLVLKPGGSWGGQSPCMPLRVLLVQRLKVLPTSVECRARRVGWGPSLKGEEERRQGTRERRGGWPLNSAVRK